MCTTAIANAVTSSGSDGAKLGLEEKLNVGMFISD
jgi:hypothetical protein